MTNGQLGQIPPEVLVRKHYRESLGPTARSAQIEKKAKYMARNTMRIIRFLQRRRRQKQQIRNK
ncbi:hypothetical protein A6F49_17115 [Enteractinococcus helveticum]|uniref:Uncharacterized protein n=1 Tax=Enteractinococcus helveticum TaxID=1837282 RepID=A0A1B7LWY8_9MICC|nr:hypothetical protein A6F49_17115 [Enteractinococcus helveticum]